MNIRFVRRRHDVFSTKFRLVLFAAVFALVAVFGLSFITGNDRQSNIGTSHASAQEPADINNDNKVDVFDLSILLSKWNTSDTTSDLNSDGTVNIFDLSMLLSKWGPVTSITPSPRTISPGAKLPITYDLASLSGTKRYVATNGNDTTGTGAIGAPYATLAKAVSVAANGDSIVIRGGMYREGNVTIPQNKTLTVTAYPGELPEFRGSQVYSGSWTTEGSYQYRAYTPQPVTDGGGISFTTGQNLTGDGVGKYPDQAWINDTQLRQVSEKTSLAAGKFWVDDTNDRIYLMASDVASGTVEVSNKDVFLSLYSPNTIVQGLKITRYSNSANDYGIIKIYNTGDNTLLKNIYVADSAFIAINYMGDSNLNLNSKLQNVTVTTSNWMGIGALYTDNLVLDGVSITNMNQFDEFTHSPQSGALKTSRTRYTKVINSEIAGNHSHGLWFDQSNVDVDVANNMIVDNLGSGVFFEISDDLLLVNNYIRASGSARAVKLAGSSGLKLVNNTIIGGADTIGIYTDVRSIPGCSLPSEPFCTTMYSSDRDSVRTLPATLDWMPRLDYMVDNIIAYPTGTGYCSVPTTLCITSTNSTANAPIETIIHQADTARGIPQTYMNSNVYANGSNRIIHTATGYYTTISTFRTAMAASPVSVSGLEANGLVGNTYVNADGSATAALNHANALALPTDADINQYLPAGMKHYGAL